MHSKRKFSWYKSLTCPEYVQFVFCSVNETYAELFLLHYAVAFCSLYLNGRKKSKSTIYMTFSVNFRTCVENSSNQDLHLRKPTVPKDTHYAQEKTFPWHTNTTCPECAPIRLVRYRASCYIPRRMQHVSEKHFDRQRFGVICVSLEKGPPTKTGCSVMQL